MTKKEIETRYIVGFDPANAWDGHTPQDVAERLAKYVGCEK